MISSKNYVQRFDFMLEVKARGLVGAASRLVLRLL